MISDLDAGWELENPAERRGAQRYRLRLPVNIRLTEKRRWSSAILIDISSGGIQLRTRARLAVGNAVGIRLRDYDGNQFELRGQVVRAPCIPLPGGFVVKFEAPARGLDALLAAARELPESERAAFLASELRPHIEVSEGAD